jgi:hypothetical protein
MENPPSFLKIQCIAVVRDEINWDIEVNLISVRPLASPVPSYAIGLHVGSVMGKTNSVEDPGQDDLN